VSDLRASQGHRVSAHKVSDLHASHDHKARSAHKVSDLHASHDYKARSAHKVSGLRGHRAKNVRHALSKLLLPHRHHQPLQR
jgi:hypothetical protein